MRATLTVEILKETMSCDFGDSSRDSKKKKTLTIEVIKGSEIEKE